MNFTILFIVAEYIAVTYVFGLVYKLVGQKLSAYIQRNFGWTGYCVLGSVGVTFHELSHLITAVIFRHKINEVKLFRPFQGKVDGTLGYVNHSWNSRSTYRKIGNFFIGTAPMFFGAGLLFILLRVAYPTSFLSVTEISEISDALLFAFNNMFIYENLFAIWTPILFLYAILVCPYMHMSWADVKGATSGAVTLIIVALLVSLASTIIPDDLMLQIQRVMNTFVTYYAFALALGLIASIIMVVCFGLLSLIRGKGL
jgi:hypothetical protein